MFWRKHGTQRTVHIHCCTETQAQNAAHLIIQFIRTHFPGFNALQIRHSQIIIIISITAAICKTIRPTTEFHIETILNGLICIMHPSRKPQHHQIPTHLSKYHSTNTDYGKHAVLYRDYKPPLWPKFYLPEQQL